MTQDFCRRFPQLCEEIRTYNVTDYRVPSMFDSDDLHPHHPDFFNPPSRRPPMLETPSGRPPSRRPPMLETPSRGPPSRRPPMLESNTRSNVTTSWVGAPIKPVKPTINKLTSQEKIKATMAMASKVANDKGIQSAQKYLSSKNVNYTIDRELSNKLSLVLVNDESGDVIVAYRGTNIGRIDDVATDMAIASSNEENVPQFRNARQQLLKVQEKYGSMPSELVGYSLGGAKAISMGNEYGIDTTTYNPFLGPKNIKNQSGNHTHNILRTTEDFASMGTGIKFPESNWAVKSILPHRDTLNPIEAHQLTNFTDDGPRRSDFRDTLNERVYKLGSKTGELVTIHDMKTAIDDGKSFTEFLREFSPNDINENGEIGSRMFGSSKWVKLWRDTGGTLNSSEEAQVNAHPSGPNEDIVVPRAERRSFVRGEQSDRENTIQSYHEELRNASEAADAYNEPHEVVRNNLVAQLHPTTIGKGLVAGYVGDQMASHIDPNNTLGIDAHRALSGGLGGGLGGLATAGMAGELVTASSLAPAAVSGGVGYVAGGRTQDAVAKGLKNAGANEDVVESVSSVSGGAVGGATTALTGIGAASLMGAEVGELGGPVGVLVGGGVGATLGAGAYLWHKISHH